MADESIATRRLPPAVRRGVLLAGLAVAGWAVARVILLLSGNEDVIAADDVHGYVAIFSLVLTPVLALAVVTLVTTLWRDSAPRITPGVALALSAPLASPLTLVAVGVGVAIVAAALMSRPDTR